MLAASSRAYTRKSCIDGALGRGAAIPKEWRMGCPRLVSYTHGPGVTVLARTGTARQRPSNDPRLFSNSSLGVPCRMNRWSSALKHRFEKFTG